MAAVTAEPTPVQGCAAVRLGAMRYLPMASRDFCDRYLGGPLGASLAKAPMLNFNRKDALQTSYLRSVTRRSAYPPTHFLPSSAAFSEAVRMGLGWGLVPEPDLRPDDDAPGGLVRLDDRHVDVPLYWQHWRVESALLRTLTEEVRAHAEAALH
ncbi:LysR substrate-binding domain-containing protein [Solicola gregarius]|uniref:LysR substrate-binding domain-containing protein n=1 Tax=Solicola gregarius TaxID=2908642 RepID=A0AA46YMB3_9ACTN|nr:LysR substrate-binding domain-containing protein [Solicola gregarius]UYM06464.1 LysR substrate-binding domain-containing protein [Solicola gregarius]